jgi:hypothetical protein
MAKVLSDYYEQDLVTPSAIFHGFDFGDRRDDGNFGYRYNFLDYCFEENGVDISARHYLDDPGKVSVVDPDMRELASDFGNRVLMFLMLRFNNVEAGFDPLPDDLFNAVRTRLTGHMQQFV